MEAGHLTSGGESAKRAWRAGRRNAWIAALVACILPALGITWGTPGLCDASPDAPLPLRSLLSFETWPCGKLPFDKYPEAGHLLFGASEWIASRIVLSADERGRIDRLSDDLAVHQAAHSGDPGFDILRPQLELGAGLEPALTRLVIAGRIATLLMALLLALSAAEVAAQLASPRFGWIAALAVPLVPGMAHYAATTNTDVPALAWALFAWALLLRGAREGRLRLFLASGVAMGLAAATKDQIVALLPGIALFALRRPCRLLARFGLLALGAGVAYFLTSGMTHGRLWLDHVRFILGPGSEPYRQFPATVAGAVDLLRASSDRLLAAGGYIGLGGLLLLVAAAILSRKFRPLVLFVPIATYVALFLIPLGYVYPRFTLPIAVCGAIAVAVAIRHLGGAPPRRRVWLGVLVGISAVGDGWQVIEAKRSDPRPLSITALAAARQPGDEAVVCPLPWLYWPFPPLAAPVRFATLMELVAERKAGVAAPRWLWFAVDPHQGIASADALEAVGKQLGMTLRSRFVADSESLLVTQTEGLVLPTVALFERDDR